MVMVKSNGKCSICNYQVEPVKHKLNEKTSK